MKKSRRIFIIVFSVSLLIAYVAVVAQQKRRRDELKMRIEDVKYLTKVYVETEKSATNINQLVELLRVGGVALHNPIAVDGRLPCYRVARPPVFHGALIEENDNVKDARLRVWSMADGSVIATLRTERVASTLGSNYNVFSPER